MSKNNRGRSTAGGPAVPRFARGANAEAAQHLRLTTSRYLAQRATSDDVVAAFNVFADAVGKPIVTDQDAVDARLVCNAMGYSRRQCRKCKRNTVVSGYVCWNCSYDNSGSTP